VRVDNVGEFLEELKIVGDFEGAHSVRVEAMFPPGPRAAAGLTASCLAMVRQLQWVALCGIVFRVR
jgi:hypothetical protein